MIISVWKEIIPFLRFNYITIPVCKQIFFYSFCTIYFLRPFYETTPLYDVLLLSHCGKLINYAATATSKVKRHEGPLAKIKGRRRNNKVTRDNPLTLQVFLLFSPRDLHLMARGLL